MRHCIFCREYKDDNQFHAEHIIFDSLGGKGSTNICKNVCEACNSSLGTRVDSYLTNHEITKYKRWLFRINGRNGIPNPLEKIEIKYADTPFIGVLKMNKKGVFTAFCAKHKQYQIKDKILIVGPREKFAEYVNSVLKGRNLPALSNETIEKNTLNLGKPKFPIIESINIPVDVKNQYLQIAFPALLKMAYEFCFVTLGEKYLDDPLATDIRKFLMGFDYRKIDHYSCPTNAYLSYTNVQKAEISLTLHKENNKLSVSINLYGFVLCTICMSETADNYNNVKNNILKVKV